MSVTHLPTAPPAFEPSYKEAADFCFYLLMQHGEHFPDDINKFDAVPDIRPSSTELSLTFQTFSQTTAALAEREAHREETGNKQADPLGKVLHGSLRKHWDKLVELNRKGAAACVVVNRTDGVGRHKANIRAVRALFVDFDKPEEEPLEKLEAFPVPPSFVVESSHGKFHAYWAVRDVTVEQFTSVQKKLAKHFCSDEGVKDLARAMRLPGLAHEKGDRPPFLTRMYKRWRSGDECTLQQIQGAASQKPIELPELTGEGGRRNALLSYGGKLRGQYIEGDALRDALERINETRMIPPVEAAELDDIIAAVEQWEPGPAVFRFTETGERPLTDLGNAERLIDQHGKNLYYIHKMKKWLVWDGSRWVFDDCGQVARLATKTVRQMYSEATYSDDKAERAVLTKHALRSEAANKLESMVKLARDAVPLASEKLDADLWLLSVANGTLNLKTGELCEPRRKDFITKAAGVTFDQDVACPMWLEFLSQIFKGDADMLEYVQRMVGYSLTGATTEQCLFLLHGSGANGKSVFLSVLQALLGDYSTTSSAETFMVKPGSSGANNDIARLRGVRLVAASEVEQGQRLAESFIKQMTGSDKLSARFLYAEFFTFTPAFKIMLAANHKPKIPSESLIS